MTLSAAQYKSKIILEVGDNDAGLLAANIDMLWAAHDSIADDWLHFLSSKRDAISVMLADVRKQVDFTDPADISAKLDQLFKHLQSMYEDTVAALAQATDLAAAATNGAGAIGTITKTAPIQPAPGQADPSARRYRGDPLCPPRRRPL